MIKKCGWILCFAFLGCVSTSATTTGAVQAPRALGCDFDILTAQPFHGYAEIGTIDVTRHGAFSMPTTDLTEFKKEIASDVCKLGGDAAIALANGDGGYLKATVLKRLAVEPAPAAVPVASAAPAKSGCEFDTQCKGDRVCVAGQCQSPTPTTAAPTSTAATPTADATSPKSAK